MGVLESVERGRTWETPSRSMSYAKQGDGEVQAPVSALGIMEVVEADSLVARVGLGVLSEPGAAHHHASGGAHVLDNYSESAMAGKSAGLLQSLVCTIVTYSWSQSDHRIETSIWRSVSLS